MISPGLSTRKADSHQVFLCMSTSRHLFRRLIRPRCVGIAVAGCDVGRGERMRTCFNRVRSGMHATATEQDTRAPLVSASGSGGPAYSGCDRSTPEVHVFGVSTGLETWVEKTDLRCPCPIQGMQEGHTRGGKRPHQLLSHHRKAQRCHHRAGRAGS